MKPRMMLPILLLAAGCSGASQAPATGASAAPPSTLAAAIPVPTGPTVVAEVVTLDTAAPSVTLREGDVPAVRAPRPEDLKTGDRTIRVMPSGVEALAKVKPGDRVRVTCSAPPAAVIMDAAPMAGMSSPGASPGTAPAAAAAPSGMPATTGSALEKCDAVIAIVKLEPGTP